MRPCPVGGGLGKAGGESGRASETGRHLGWEGVAQIPGTEMWRWSHDWTHQRAETRLTNADAMTTVSYVEGQITWRLSLRVLGAS